MLFIAGLIVGILVALLLIASSIYLRIPIESTVRSAKATIEPFAPRPKGYVFEAEDEATQARNEIIARNKKAGKDTRLTELS
jgi:hypothetical protein